ncbi:MAG: helix-turn-helix transcriptional regulator, partial [Bacteroidota bacterium]
ANRFYDRQFINRRELSAGLLLRFNRQLEEYFKSGKLKTNGIPSIEIIANQLSISQRYLSDSLKKQAGKTTTEHLQLFLINKAKDILLQPDKSISEVAYELGFEYPQYFSRLFKKKEGISPSVFREKYALR